MNVIVTMNAFYGYDYDENWLNVDCDEDDADEVGGLGGRMIHFFAIHRQTHPQANNHSVLFKNLKSNLLFGIISKF